MFHLTNKLWVLLISITFLISMVAGVGANANNTIINSVGGFKEDTSAPTLLIDGNLSVIYVGALYCPYCAMERWAFVMALSDYGNFSGLGNTVSAEDNIATYDFINATYNSTKINLQTAEVYDNNNTLLQPMNSLEAQYFNKYNSAGYIPFICVGGKIFQTGAGTSLNIANFKGLSFTDIQNQLATKSGTLYNEIYAESQNIKSVINQSLASNDTTNIATNNITSTITTTVHNTQTTPAFEVMIVFSAIILVAFRKKLKYKP